MASTCEVCSTESSKYRCPACGLASCSLACSQAHKVYCTPKTTTDEGDGDDRQTTVDAAGQNQAAPEAELNGDHKNEPAVQEPDPYQTVKPHEPAINEPALRDQLARNPDLRALLRDIYRATLEEEWEIEEDGEADRETGAGRVRGRGRGRGRGGRGRGARRGPWTPEKGFNRGVGRVRGYRRRCEEGLEHGRAAEGFGGFVKGVVEGGGDVA